VPHKDKIKSKNYHHDYYLKHRAEQLKLQKELRKLYPWKYILVGIKQRCENPKDQDYKYYGLRGIKCNITEEEIKELYIRDNASQMKRPSIDRIDNDGDYCLSNCRFIEQSKNSIRANKLHKPKKILQFSLNGKFIKEWKSISQASEFYNCHISNISNNLLLKNQTACGYIWRYKC